MSFHTFMYLDPPITEPVPEPLFLRFHDNFGKNVELSSRYKVAERVKGQNHGVVLFRYPLLINRLYEVKLEKKDACCSGDPNDFLYCGVTLEPPEDLILPNEALDWGYSLVVNPTHIDYRRKFRPRNQVGKKLERLAEGSRIGLAVDNQSSIRLYINGEDQGVVIGLGVPVPCYGFFDLRGPYRKISTLPIRELKTKTATDSNKQ